MTRLDQRSMHNHHRLMVIWLILSVIGGQFTSTMVMAEEFLNASDVPCHTTGVDEARSCPCCDGVMAMECDYVAQCDHGQLPVGITNMGPSLATVLNVQDFDPPTTQYVERYSQPLFRPPIIFYLRSTLRLDPRAVGPSAQVQFLNN